MQASQLILIVASLSVAAAWSPIAAAVHSPIAHRRSSSLRLEFGDFFYEGHWEPLPENVFEVAVRKPCGIQFEEDGPIVGKNGVTAIAVLDGSNAAATGQIQPGDKLVGVTAVLLKGAKWERQLFDCRKWSFDTVVDAIGSNEEKFDCRDVILQFERKPGSAPPPSEESEDES